MLWKLSASGISGSCFFFFFPLKSLGDKLFLRRADLSLVSYRMKSDKAMGFQCFLVAGPSQDASHWLARQ